MTKKSANKKVGQTYRYQRISLLHLTPEVSF
nr:MAG TPA: hypothetical protein [Herelleviridae sp.]